MGIVVIVVIILIILYRMGKSADNNISDNQNTGANKNISNPSTNSSGNSPAKINNSINVMTNNIEKYYKESVFHILCAKEYYYIFLESVKDYYEDVKFWSKSPCEVSMDGWRTPTKSQVKEIERAYLALKSSKNKFCYIYGSGKTDLKRLMNKGIYIEKVTETGKLISYDGDINAIIKYLSDVDCEFKSQTEKRIKRFCILNAEDSEDNEIVYDHSFWNIYYSIFRDCIDEMEYERQHYSSDAIEAIYKTVEFIDVIYGSIKEMHI